MRNFSSPSLHVTVRNFARIVALELALTFALELVHALALGLKYLLQRTSLCVCIPHTWGEHRHLFLLAAAAAAEAIEVGAAPRSLPPR